MQNLIFWHTFRIDQSGTENDIEAISKDWSDKGGDVTRIVLSVAIERDDNVRSEEFCGLDTGLGRSTFPTVEFLP